MTHVVIVMKCNLLLNKESPYGETVLTKSRTEQSSLHSIEKINVTNELFGLHSSDSKEVY